MSATVERPGGPMPAQEREPPPLRVAVVAPPWFEVPPRSYGGTEAVVGSLVDQLVERGIEVTLVAAGESRTKAQHFVRVYASPPSSRLGQPVPEVMEAAVAARALDSIDVDIIHDHTLAGPLLARGDTVPVVATMHGPVTGENGDYFEALGDTIDLVAISHSQRRLRPALHWVGTVYNGVDVASYPFQADKGDDLLWIGRFNADKGPRAAIEIARRTGRRLTLAGKMSEPAEKSYFDEYIRPWLSDDIEYIGLADGATKRRLYAQAYAFVFPIRWQEPFGMVMAEAMACGTPVVATRFGSVPEVVEDDVTGFVVDDPDDLGALCDAVERAGSLDPHACRERVSRLFDVSVMGAGYERVYRELLGQDVGE